MFGGQRKISGFLKVAWHDSGNAAWRPYRCQNENPQILTEIPAGAGSAGVFAAIPTAKDKAAKDEAAEADYGDSEEEDADVDPDDVSIMKRKVAVNL